MSSESRNHGDAQLRFKFKEMRTDWLLMEKERLERKMSETADQSLMASIEVDLQYIKSELSHRAFNAPLSGLEDNQVQETLNEGYW